MYGYRGPHQGERAFFAAPFVGGLLGGFLGSAIAYPRPRPFYPPYPPYYGPYPPYYGYPYSYGNFYR